jgi:hypothetical protein
MELNRNNPDGFYFLGFWFALLNLQRGCLFLQKKTNTFIITIKQEETSKTYFIFSFGGFIHSYRKLDDFIVEISYHFA